MDRERARRPQHRSRAWPKTDPNLRLCLAQAFLWANRHHVTVSAYEPEETATALAGVTFDHDLWEAFAETQLQELYDAWAEFFSGHYGVASRPRPVGIDYELVKFVQLEGDAPVVITEPTFVQAQVFLMHQVDGAWLVAGFGVDTPPEPGWPSTPGHPTF
jgi:hypothetical protein